ncbi:MAG: hypothetical protein H0A75_09185 [Candidatus Methanofishera endochildressiae]|uniref:Uncharacterized protein n=1 Tax=Candidatus Methanofishera endochildressiae TaxID=2738884 RepID=A0A7Z0MQE7_9GAMM|nr:hypothetical protein [Candidatus Methanofishera endochildressiae]
MAYLKEILELISDKTGDVTAKATALDAIIDGRISDLDAAVTSQEGAKLEAIKTRDSSKTAIRRIESALGVDLSSGDDIESVLSGLKKGGKESDLVATKDKEISALKAEITASNKQYPPQMKRAMLLAFGGCT